MREDDVHEEAASEIFHTYGKSTGVAAATGGAAIAAGTAAAMHRNQRSSASPTAPHLSRSPIPANAQQEGAGQYYDTGYDQYFQYESNPAYGYHPAAVYSPALAPPSHFYQASSYNPNNPYYQQQQQAPSTWPEQDYYYNNEPHSHSAQAQDQQQHGANYYQHPNSDPPFLHHDDGRPSNLRQ